MRMCFIHVERGKMIHSMGVTRKSRRALYLEETLWLIQQRKLSVVLEERDVKDKKKHLDWRKFNQRYFSDSPYFLEWYSVYNYLRECHYIARRYVISHCFTHTHTYTHTHTQTRKRKSSNLSIHKEFSNIS